MEHQEQQPNHSWINLPPSLRDDAMNESIRESIREQIKPRVETRIFEPAIPTGSADDIASARREASMRSRIETDGFSGAEQVGIVASVLILLALFITLALNRKPKTVATTQQATVDTPTPSPTFDVPTPARRQQTPMHPLETSIAIGGALVLFGIPIALFVTLCWIAFASDLHTAIRIVAGLTVAPVLATLGLATIRGMSQ